MRLHPPQRVQEYTEQGWWGEVGTWNDVFRRSVQARPDALAIVDPANLATLTGAAPRRLTWSELDDEVGRFASVLIAHGAVPGDVIAIQLPNSVDLCVAYLAMSRIGVIATPLPMQFQRRELTEACARLGAETLVTAGWFGEREYAVEALALRRHLPVLRTILATGPDVPEGAVSLSHATKAAEPREAATARRERRGHRLLDVRHRGHPEGRPALAQRLAGDRLGQRGRAAGSPPTTCCSTRSRWSTWPASRACSCRGCSPARRWCSTTRSTCRRSSARSPPSASPTRSRRRRCSRCYCCRPEILKAADISSLRILGSGSAPLSTAMVRGWKDRHGIDVINYFGSNEGVSLVGDPETIPEPGRARAVLPPDRRRRLHLAEPGHPRHPHPAGRPRHRRRRSPRPGRPGELRIAGPTVFAGYLDADHSGENGKNRLDTSCFDDQGYFRTGDVFEIAAGDDGDPRYYRYVDRSKDLIIRGGMNVSPAELEQVLAAHPAVAEVAVVGYPDQVLGERICAVLVPRPEADGDVLLSINAVREFLVGEGVADFKLPERVELVAALPRNPVGKILKRELRESLREAAP